MKNNLYCFFFLLCSFAFLPQSQAQIEDLTQDAAFFAEQTKVYQRWLDQSGLGQYLSVYDIDVEKDHLSLYLKFPFEDLDAIRSAWDRLKADFEAESALTLEEQLFYKASFIMEVRQSIIDVQIYDTYDLRQEPLFMRAVFFEDGQVKTEKNDPRAERVTVELQPINQGEAKEEGVAAFRQQYTRQAVYDCIYAYAQSRYGRTECIERHPEIRLLENDKNLIFEVSDLCREVLTDEANPTLCGILSGLGYDCNWVKRELLRFTCTYEETRDGFRLIILIDGKYGSGFYSKVRRGGYIDMEVDFDEYLEVYAKIFATELRSQLQNCK